MTERRTSQFIINCVTARIQSPSITDGVKTGSFTTQNMTTPDGRTWMTTTLQWFNSVFYFYFQNVNLTRQQQKHFQFLVLCFFKRFGWKYPTKEISITSSFGKGMPTNTHNKSFRIVFCWPKTSIFLKFRKNVDFVWFRMIRLCSISTLVLLPFYQWLFVWVLRVKPSLLRNKLGE